MCVTTSQYEISGKNSHLLSQKVFLRSIIYPSQKTIHWNKQHFGMRYRPPPLFLHFVSTIKHYWSIEHYTCQLFLSYKREIFILGVLGFLQTTQSFAKIPEEVRSLPKTSEVCQRRSYRENAYPQNQRSRGRYCHLFILHMVFVPYMGLS